MFIDSLVNFYLENLISLEQAINSSEEEIVEVWAVSFPQVIVREASVDEAVTDFKNMLKTSESFVFMINNIVFSNTEGMKELSTQEAADILHVSRPFLIKLLETKKIPFRKVGTRRKVLLKDLMLYKTKNDEARRKILDELAQEAQELGLY